MTIDELCEKIEESAREAARAASRGDWKRVLIELDAARYLAQDAKEIVETSQQPTESSQP